MRLLPTLPPVGCLELRACLRRLPWSKTWVLRARHALAPPLPLQLLVLLMRAQGQALCPVGRSREALVVEGLALGWRLGGGAFGLPWSANEGRGTGMSTRWQISRKGKVAKGKGEEGM